jgi:hypothetical protein
MRWLATLPTGCRAPVSSMRTSSSRDMTGDHTLVGG